jgi:hypothetical protein
MADWHLDYLERALNSQGWRVVAIHPGNDYDLSGSWEIERSATDPTHFIDLDGLDDMQCLPMSESYGCQLRGRPDASLYFRRNRSLTLWQFELNEFVKRI